MNTIEFLQMAALMHGFISSSPTCVVQGATILDAPTGTVRMDVPLADLFNAYCKHMAKQVAAQQEQVAIDARYDVHGNEEVADESH